MKDPSTDSTTKFLLQLTSLLLPGENMFTVFNPTAKKKIRGPCNLHIFLDTVDMQMMSNLAAFAMPIFVF